jgi:agmatine deiminase
MEPDFCLLPEWNPQRAVLINWPHFENHHWDPVRDSVNRIFQKFVKTLVMKQSVMVVCYDIAHRNHIQKLLINANVNLPRVRFFIIPTDDIWIRDYGPLSLGSKDRIQLMSFEFNGWGKKFPYERDNLASAHLFQQGFFPQALFSKIDFVLEGGSIETDGLGTLLTTRCCLLSSNRNPGFYEHQIEDTLKKHLGVQKIIWLEHGYLAGDDTDGHIDTLARFVDPQTICYTQCLDSRDENYKSLLEMEKQLQSLKNLNNEPYRLIPLPMPQPIYSAIEGKRLPATYTKFFITNHLVFVPFYDDSSDLLAQKILKKCFPAKEIVGISCRSLLENYGNLHCMAMQVPV